VQSTVVCMRATCTLFLLLVEQIILRAEIFHALFLSLFLFLSSFSFCYRGCLISAMEDVGGYQYTATTSLPRAYNGGISSIHSPGAHYVYSCFSFKHKEKNTQPRTHAKEMPAAAFLFFAKAKKRKKPFAIANTPAV